MKSMTEKQQAQTGSHTGKKERRTPSRQSRKVRKAGSRKSQTKAGQSLPAKRRRSAQSYGWLITLGLALLLVFMTVCLWALFISGPARLHEARIRQVTDAIEAEVPGIEGLVENDFDYVTWQGYTSDTLYWFDMTGSIITTRPVSTLNYDEARETAKTKYDFEPDTVTLAYGYSAPVYLLESNAKLLMLDYDSLEWVYERNLTDAQPQ